MKKLPIGIQTFEKIRKENYIYIDKTKEAYELIDNYTYAFLSRPRRFGKSLFLDTLKNIFEGKKEFFEGLYIYDKWNWEDKYPVITINWAGEFDSDDKLRDRAYEILLKSQKELKVECNESKTIGGCLEELIQKTYRKYDKRVVILIDEYDKPILDVIENPTQAKKNREFLKALYSIIKANDEYIKFAFLVGVSKFSKASIFSGLNMFSDISLNPNYGNICGYTQNDIETTFKPYLEGVDLTRFKKFYNGYNFLADDIYNPFDVLKFIINQKIFRNYWYESGNPSFLIKLMDKNKYFLPELSNLIVDEKLLDSFDIESIDFEVILYQSGYLTIEEMIQDEDGISYKLKIPNIEVKQALFDDIARYLTKEHNTLKLRKSIRAALKTADLESLKNILFSIYASIPYNDLTNIKEYEGYYASVAFAYIQALGIQIIGEDVTNKGRIDLTCFIEDKIYIIEFKTQKNGKRPLEQIKENKYYEKYQNQNKDIYLVGIKFDTEDRNIKEFEWEKLI